VNVVVPELGEVGEVKLVRWLVAPGQEVEAGEALAEVEADKAVFVVEAPAAGVLERILVGEGEPTSPGETIALLKTS